MRAGVNACSDDICANSTALRPVNSAKRKRSAITAGTAAVPGRLMPAASTMQAIVLAVPITMQVPVVGASFSLTASISVWSISLARNLAQ